MWWFGDENLNSSCSSHMCAKQTCISVIRLLLITGRAISITSQFDHHWFKRGQVNIWSTSGIALSNNQDLIFVGLIWTQTNLQVIYRSSFRDAFHVFCNHSKETHIKDRLSVLSDITVLHTDQIFRHWTTIQQNLLLLTPPFYLFCFLWWLVSGNKSNLEFRQTEYTLCP